MAQEYTTDERQTLDESLVLFNEPASLKHYKTGTKLYTAQLTDKGEGFLRLQSEVKAPAEHVIAYYMANAVQFNNRDDSFVTTIRERCNDHSVILQSMVPMPSPLQDRQLTLQGLWEKLDDTTYFLAQL